MGGQNTTTTTSGSSDPQVQQAISTLGSQLNTQLGQGYKGFEGSLVPSLSGQTTAGINALTNNPNNAAYGAGITGAINRQADIASGNLQDDPYRNRLISDTAAATNAALQGSGRFGSGANENALIRNISTTLAPYDYQREQAALQALPGLYGASNMPASASLQAGQLMDAYNTAQAQEAARQFDVQNNAGFRTIAQGTQALAGIAPAAGTTTSTTQPTTPWWQTLAGGAIGLGSTFL